MDFLKSVSIREKLNRIVMLTTSVALLLAALGFFMYDLLAFRNTEARELSSVADIIAANSTASLQFQDPATSREALETLSIDPRVVPPHCTPWKAKFLSPITGTRRLPCPTVPGRPVIFLKRGRF